MLGSEAQFRGLKATWDTLDQGLFEKLGASMNDRIEAVIVAKDWHTEY
jgi:hypothetical protein